MASRFLFLSAKIINPAVISHINLKPKMYEIYLSVPGFSGFSIFGTGWISDDQYRLQVFEEQSPKDYASITEWLVSNPVMKENSPSPPLNCSI